MLEAQTWTWLIVCNITGICFIVSTRAFNNFFGAFSFSQRDHDTGLGSGVGESIGSSSISSSGSNNLSSMLIDILLIIKTFYLSDKRMPVITIVNVDGYILEQHNLCVYIYIINEQELKTYKGLSKQLKSISCLITWIRIEQSKGFQQQFRSHSSHTLGHLRQQHLQQSFHYC